MTKIALKITFFIVDVEFDSEYSYNGYFLSRDEANRFIEENKEVGNTITTLAEEYMDADKIDFDSIHYPEG